MYMTEAGYRQYLSETRKRELRRRALSLPNPSGAYLYLEGLLSEKWTWAVSTRIDRFYQWMESGVYGVYGL